MPKGIKTYKKQTNDVANKLIAKVDTEFVNQMLAGNSETKDFAISKSTLANISSWALNGESDKEIREHLDLTEHQFAILLTVCPTLVMIMDTSRAMADLIIAGSLVQTAIGGKRIRKQQAVKVGVYEENELGQKVKTGEKIEVVWLEEEMPPNPMLLKFLAENKLNEKFGESKGVDEEKIRQLADQFGEHDMKTVLDEAKRKVKELNGNN